MKYIIYATNYGYRLELYIGEQLQHESMHASKPDAVRAAKMAGATLYGLQS